jgi:hypothetical protein
MALDTSRLDPEVMDNLVENYGVGDIEQMTPEQAFDAWCDYEGLVNYGPQLRLILLKLKMAEVPKDESSTAY